VDQVSIEEEIEERQKLISETKATTGSD